MSEAPRFTAAIDAIDAANADDPSTVDGVPLAQFEGRTAHGWVLRLDAQASEVVQLAARAHHLRRWQLPRSAFPDGRSGYLRWRREQQRRHAAGLAELLARHGYGAAEIDRATAIITKQGLATDPEVQLFEDAVALTFLESQLDLTRAKLADDDKLVEVLCKTLAKMTPRGREAAATIDVGDTLAPLVARAIAAN